MVHLKPTWGTVDVGRVAHRRSPDVDVAFADVLAAASRGAPWACHQLYDETAGRVCGYLRAQGAPEPEDLTSDVFLRVFDRLPQFSGDATHFRSWVFTIAHHILVDDSRRRRSRPRTVGAVDDLDAAAVDDVEQEALAHIGSDAIEQLVASLPSDQRAVVMLRVAADLPIAEVAEILGKRVGAVKALQHRALASLRRRLEEVSA